MERQRFERDFREALSCGLGPLKLSAALAAILPQIKQQRDLGASWQQICMSLSAVLEAEGRPPVSAATLRGLVRRLYARKPAASRPVSAIKPASVWRAPASDTSKTTALSDLSADAAADLAAKLQALKQLS